MSTYAARRGPQVPDIFTWLARRWRDARVTDGATCDTAVPAVRATRRIRRCRLGLGKGSPGKRLQEPLALRSSSNLDDLHAQTADQLVRLQSTRPAESSSRAEGGLFSRLLRGKKRDIDPPRPGFAETAAFTLQWFRDLATKACEHRLPVLLHF